jgi:hypothetical protein
VQLAWSPHQLASQVLQAAPHVLAAQWRRQAQDGEMLLLQVSLGSAMGAEGARRRLTTCTPAAATVCTVALMLPLQARVALVEVDAAKAALKQLAAEPCPPAGYAPSTAAAAGSGSGPDSVHAPAASVEDLQRLVADVSVWGAAAALQRPCARPAVCMLLCINTSSAHTIPPHVNQGVLLSMQLATELGHHDWLVGNAAAAAWNTLLPILQRERHADAACLLLPLLQQLLHVGVMCGGGCTCCQRAMPARCGVVTSSDWWPHSSQHAGGAACCSASGPAVDARRGSGPGS